MMVAIDFEIASAAKIPTAKGQDMVRGMGLYSHKGLILSPNW